VLAASRFRFDSENDVGVTPRSLETSLDVLARTAGATGTDASLARIDALLARENALFPVESAVSPRRAHSTRGVRRIFAQRSGRGGAAKAAAAAAAAQAAAKQAIRIRRSSRVSQSHV
jgi:hypothetical protein